jgi:hypothetical protein
MPNPLTVSVISPPWLTESGQPEMVSVRIDFEGAAEALAAAADMTVQDAAEYLEFLSVQRAEYLAAIKHGAVGHG